MGFSKNTGYNIDNIIQDFYSKMAPTWLYVDIRLVMVAAKFSDLSPRKIRRLDLF